MFSGIYTQQLDDKGRVRIPAKLRAELGKSFIVMKGIGDNVTLYTSEEFDKFTKQFDCIDECNVEAQEAITEIYSYVFNIDEDSQGRFVIPQILKSEGSIDRNIVIKGARNKIEIWSEAKHEARTANKPINELLQFLKGEKQNG